MATASRLSQVQQIQSFWNLIQASDEGVQKGLLRLLNTKFASVKDSARTERSCFFGLKGALKSKGDAETDQKMLEGYLVEKYGK